MTNKHLRCSLELNDLNLSFYIYETGEQVFNHVYFKQTLLFEGTTLTSQESGKMFTLSNIISKLLVLQLLGPLHENGTGIDRSFTTAELDWYQSQEYKTLYQYLWHYIWHNRGGNAGSSLDGMKEPIDKYFENRYTDYIHPHSFNLYDVVCKNHCSFEKGWYRATIALTELEQRNFLALFGNCTGEVKNKLLAAVTDNFKKVETDRQFENILFQNEAVKFYPEKYWRTTDHFAHMITENY